MIAALPAGIPENGLSWIQVGTVKITEFICSIRLLLENIIDNLIEVSRWSLSNAQENSHVSVQHRWAISFVLSWENGRTLEIKQGLLTGKTIVVRLEYLRHILRPRQTYILHCLALCATGHKEAR